MTSLDLAQVLRDPQAHSAADLDFAPDALGHGFGFHFIEMGTDPDGEAPVRCTLVRFKPDTISDEDYYSQPAMLFVHGMTDYFFQVHVAEHFTDAGYAVYGVDLRKCGRSWREGQTWHHVTDQSIYDEDLSVCLALLSTAHRAGVIPVGHSTGGLDVTGWLSRLCDAATDPAANPGAAALHSQVLAAVLNSPWLGLQFNAGMRFAINYVITAVAKANPTAPLPGGINPVYGRSLHVTEAGEWDYDLELKPLEPRPKFVSWLAGVAKEIKRVQSGRGQTGVPTLILTSDKHRFSTKLTEESYEADLILMPEQMWANARNVSPQTTVVVIDNAMHDVFLSRLPVRQRAFEETTRWLHDVRRFASFSKDNS